MRRSGSVARTYAVNTGRCLVEGCDRPSFAKNFCAHHYEKQRHPLSHLWRIMRSRYPGQYPPAWDRFEAFLADVGERPSPKHQLRRVLVSEPYSAANIKWVAPVGAKPNYFTPEQQAAYGREWNLQRKFGITGEEYAALLAEQGGVCAACKGAETHRYKSGKLKDLAVDHDHATKTVRGLLCFNCNQGIGRFKDDPDLLRAAAAYLERRRGGGLVCEAAPVSEVAWASLMPAGGVS